MFAQHASETKQQHEALTMRLDELGGIDRQERPGALV